MLLDDVPHRYQRILRLLLHRGHLRPPRRPNPASAPPGGPLQRVLRVVHALRRFCQRLRRSGQCSSDNEFLAITKVEGSGR